MMVNAGSPCASLPPEATTQVVPPGQATKMSRRGFGDCDTRHIWLPAARLVALLASESPAGDIAEWLKAEDRAFGWGCLSGELVKRRNKPSRA
jgi:hypothetical protein